MMKSIYSLFFLLSTLLVSYSPTLAATPGDLVDVPKQELKTYLRPLLKQVIAQTKLPFTAPDTDPKLANPRHDVNIYRITYWTTGIEDLHLPRAQRKLVKASGMLFLPLRTQGKTALVSYQHGTTANKNNVPSNPANVENLLPAAIFAGNGFAVSAPDYLGFGQNPLVIHPYLHAETEATASADMLLAVEKVVQALKKSPRDPKVTLSRELFLAGYSQGGHATMALHRYLEKEKPLKNFDIVASAPMAGPYDLSKSCYEWALAQDRPYTSFYISYMILGMNPIYEFYTDKKEIFADGVASKVESIYDGTSHPPGQDPKLPLKLAELFQPDFYQAVKNDPDSLPGTKKLFRAFAENDVYEWVPRAPIRLYHAEGDDVVPFSNSEVAYDYMKKAGADVQLIPLGQGLNHVQGAIAAAPKVVTWFDQVRAD